MAKRFVPEYDTDGGAINLWRYFTMTKQYFTPKEIDAFTKENIERKVSKKMGMVRINGKEFNQPFINAFSRRVPEVKKIADEIREASIVETMHTDRRVNRAVIVFRRPTGKIITSVTLLKGESQRQGLQRLQGRFKIKLKQLE